MISIVLPAYNEEESLPGLLGRIRQTMSAYGKAYQVIVVDDGSADDTVGVATRFSSTMPVRLIKHEKNGGLGRALRTGLLAAMESSTVILTMDADDSHDPELVPLMIERIQMGYDLVVASRFQTGGQEVGVAGHRKMLSRAASGIMRFTFPFEGIRDYSCGYRAYRVSLLRKLAELHGHNGLVTEQGFACMVELLIKAGLVNARMTEVPLVLRYDRKLGASKMRVVRTVKRYWALIGSTKTRRRPDRAHLPPRPQDWKDLGCRALSLAVAAVSIFLTAPLMLAIGLLVKFTSPGPIFYAQTRIGLDRRRGGPDSLNGRRRINYGGKPFTILKFRTMRVNAELGTGAVWANPEDPRITAVGRILRKYRFDELPQLFNVLRGHMNIVGPRPERPHIVENLSRHIPRYHSRHRVRPGITGWAQINHHYDQSIDDVRRKVGYDLEYIGRQSFFEDLRIMFRTVPVILFKRGAI